MAGEWKTVVCIGDLHCGHRAGLAPPDFQVAPEERWDRWRKVQEELWHEYMLLVKKYRKPHLLIANGDLIDGRNGKQGGRELTLHTIQEQRKCAVACLKPWQAANTLITFGTPYHVGELEDEEKAIAELLGATFSNGQPAADGWPPVMVDDVVIDVRHHMSSSPMWRGTPLKRLHILNLLWAERDERPKADIILRSHVHWCEGIWGRGWEVMSLPALQAAGTIYGGRICEGTVDWGIVVFKIRGKQWQKCVEIIPIGANVRSAIRY